MAKKRPGSYSCPVSQSTSLFRPVLNRALESALDHLEGLDTRSVAATATLEQLRNSLRKPLNAEGIVPQLVIEELVRDAKDGVLGSAGGRFFAWVIGGSLPAALAADWLTSAWDQNAAISACGPSAAVVEEVVGEWLKDLLGLPASASFALVTGCQMAHATCLAAARYSLLAERGWDVERQGLFGAPRIRLLSSSRSHGSFERAVRFLGLGQDQVHDLPVDESDSLIPDALEQALEADPRAPAIVLLQAGDINIGAYDNFQNLIPIAKRFGAWVHVDGAFGLWAAASPRYRHFVEGIEAADSWATDGHKWLNVPFDCGYAIVSDSHAHSAAMSHRAVYLKHDLEARDQIDWNPEWSRRARGFSTYAALRQLGRSGVAALVERCCEHARALVLGIGSLPGAQVVWEPRINQGLLRFPDPGPKPTAADDDAHTETVIGRIFSTGEAFFGPTTWRSFRCMRVSVCNWQTSERDVQRAIDAVKAALG
jgi:glutamate/tyrosine decarboxylase-like PLP-dependent enzyme